MSTTPPGDETNPASINPVVDAADVVTAGLFRVASEAAIVAIDAEVPFLADPGIREIVKLVVDDISNKISEALQQAAAFGIIDAQTNAEAAAYQNAKAALLAAKSSGDKNAIDKANQDFDSTFASIVHWN